MKSQAISNSEKSQSEQSINKMYPSGENFPKFPIYNPPDETEDNPKLPI
jgi:hypothetical protein